MPLRKKKTRRVIRKTRRKSSKRLGGLFYKSKDDLVKMIDEKINDDENLHAKLILDMAYSKNWLHDIGLETIFRNILDRGETDGVEYEYFDMPSRRNKKISISAESIQKIKKKISPLPAEPPKPPPLLRPQTQKVFDTHFDKYIKELNQVVESICEKEQLYVMFNAILELIDQLEQTQTFDSYTFIKTQIQKLVSNVDNFKPYTKNDSQVKNDLNNNKQFYADILRNLVQSYYKGPNVFTFIEVLKNFVDEHSNYCNKKLALRRYVRLVSNGNG